MYGNTSVARMCVTVLMLHTRARYALVTVRSLKQRYARPAAALLRATQRAPLVEKSN